MKKTIKNSSKRKWIVGGVAFFGAVALLTTGFATWVIGANKGDDQTEVDVTVDTANNNSLYLTAQAADSDTLTLKEETSSSPASGKIINVEDGGTPDFNVQIDYTISVGNALTVYGLKVEFVENPAGTDLLTNTNLGFDVETGRADDLHYLDFVTNPTDHDGGDGEATYDQTYTYKLPQAVTNNASADPEESSFTLEFYWGKFFNNKKPSEYYNGLNYSGDSKENLVKAATFVEQELDTMASSLTNIQLKITAVTEPIE